MPSSDEIAHIADVQIRRQAEHKRRSREITAQKRKSGHGSGSLRPKSDSGPRPTSSGQHGSLSTFFRHSRTGEGEGEGEDSMRHRAATVIQRTYRGYRVRREMKGLGIDASTRWVHALREAQFRALTTPRARTFGFADGEDGGGGGGGDGGGDAAGGASTWAGDAAGGDGASSVVGGTGHWTSTAARRNWKKAATIARRAGGDVDAPAEEDETSSSESEEASSDASDRSKSSEQKKAARRRREAAKEKRKKDAKTMGLQYFLEMVDLKHRYGSNLRMYHEEWKKADTNENFFYWLDYGEGRYVDIDACPRERLDREQVRYLSREERQYYLVKVDGEGRLCWTKNGARIDTTEKWKDSIHGIVPADDPTPEFKSLSTNETRLLGDSSTGSSDDPDSETSSHHHGATESELEADRAAKYATPSLDRAKGVKKVTHVSASTVFNKLLRKSVRKNTWIFVADTSFRLYVGIKNSGAFQHSSFLQGSRISAAGLIKIKNGRLASLSPLSGHYRPPASNFRAFVKSLKEEGVDMRHVSISKAYAVLVGLEAYMKTRSKGKDLLKKMTLRRDRIISPEEVKRKEEEERDKSESAAMERKVLEEEQKRRDENRAGVQLMQKLHIQPREPSGQKGPYRDGGTADAVDAEADVGSDDR